MIGKKFYPIDILPKRGYFPKINLELLFKKQAVYLVRRSDLSREETFNSTGTLRESALEIKSIPYLSLNLLGSKFLPEHSCYKTKNKGSAKWNGVTSISILDYISEYEIKKEYCLVYLHGNALHNVSIPFEKNETPESKNFSKR